MGLTRKEVSVVFFHGGVAGLAVGAFILPARLAPHDANDPWYDDPWREAGDFCFVTINILDAWYSALNCKHERGDAMVYHLKLIGRLWLDIDETGANFACRRALILARHRVPRHVKLTRRTSAPSWMSFMPGATLACDRGVGKKVSPSGDANRAPFERILHPVPLKHYRARLTGKD
jgi:hypothetical protein